MLAILAGIVLLAGLLIFRDRLTSPSAEEVNRLLSESRHAELQKLRQRYSENQSATNLINSLAGDFEVQRRRWQAALDHYSLITDGSQEKVTLVLSNSAHCLLNLGQSANAEHIHKTVLSRSPQNQQSLRDLANMMLAGGRSYDAIPYLNALIQLGHSERVDLIFCASPELFHLPGERFAQTCLAAVPDAPRPMLGPARNALREKNFDYARLWLSDIVNKFPETLEAQARLGQLYLELDEIQNLTMWYSELPETAAESPGIWFAKAQLFERLERPEASARCLAEALTRFPDHVGANYQMTTILKTLEKDDESKHFAVRSKILARVELLASDLSEAFDETMCQEIVSSTAELGRYWEATAWCEIAKQEVPKPEWFEKFQRQCNEDGLLLGNRQDPPAIAAILRQLKRYELPDLDRLARPSPQPTAPLDNTPISFKDDSESAGFQFTYRNGTTPDSIREYLFEFNGGGVGVVDFDCDSWPDIALTQAGDKPWNQSSESDRLFRNLDGQRFQSVSTLAGFTDSRYGQGIASGDINNDGFPDLYVANFGPNQLYINNGDGTFSRSPAASGGHQWTSSCAIADLNGDGSSDIYAVNYLNAEEVQKRDCRSSQAPRCSPSNFSAGEDAIFLSQHDGTFSDASAQSGVQSPLGKGLGLIVADFNRDNHLDVFVGNDTTQNNLYINTPHAAEGELVFEDEALLAGCAFDSNGIAQACMGIAAASLDFDGTPDLFVTNFYNDANTLYTEQGDGTFREYSRQSNLGRVSFGQLGFGTQFLDADIDGDLDLVIANGHIYRFPEASGIPYRMPAQALRNSAGSFEIIPPSEVGEFFARNQLGRAVARLDWNGDGRQDICISHLDTPAAILTNETKPVGTMLSIRLVGVVSNRDAIGARVTVIQNSLRMTQQLIAGDGYQSRNEQSLYFSVPSTERVTITVGWPSMFRTSRYDIPASEATRLTIVEQADGSR